MTLLEWAQYFEDDQIFVIRLDDKVIASRATKELIRRTKELRNLNMDLARAKISIDRGSNTIYIDFIKSDSAITLGSLFKLIEPGQMVFIENTGTVMSMNTAFSMGLLKYKVERIDVRSINNRLSVKLED